MYYRVIKLYEQYAALVLYKYKYDVDKYNI